LLYRRIERQIFAAELEIFLEHGYDEGVVFALGQARYGDGANTSGAGEGDGKTAAVVE